MKLLHAADLHIDSPMRGLSSYEGAPAEDLRLASRRALANLVDLALSEEVTAVLLAGDIFDGDWTDFHTGLFFAKQMTRLREGEIKVLVVSGNHDAASTMSRGIPLPDNVVYLDTRAPQTIPFEDLGLAVHGQGFAERKTMENLARAYPEACSGLFNVGLLHTSIGKVDGHDTYAPCDVSDLVAKGYDYWALGHVHTRQVVQTDPWIVFPGNIQGRNARETGPKGCTLIQTEDLRVTSVEHRDLDVARWEHLVVDVAGAEDLDDVADRVRAAFDAVPSHLLHAVRVSLTGATQAHTRLHNDHDSLVNALRAVANDLPALWLEKAVAKTRSAYDDDPALAGLLADARRVAADSDHDRIRAFVDGNALYGVLPPQLRGVHALDLSDHAFLDRIADGGLALLEAELTEDK